MKEELLKCKWNKDPIGVEFKKIDVDTDVSYKAPDAKDMVFVFDKHDWYDPKEGFKGKLMTKEEADKEIEGGKCILYTKEQATDPYFKHIKTWEIESKGNKFKVIFNKSIDSSLQNKTNEFISNMTIKGSGIKIPPEEKEKLLEDLKCKRIHICYDIDTSYYILDFII